ncbi:MAG: pilus assembly protein [Verrucomicrobiae bacterium]|nr:pilus assembly protein [Verrucomicrobiae bacterium]
MRMRRTAQPTTYDSGPIRALACAALAHCRRSDSAQATLEFVLMFPIALVFIMAIYDFAGIGIANQVTQYAAFTAARIAVVNTNKAEDMTFMALTPITPAKISRLPIPPLPIPDAINKLLEEILGIDQAADRAAYAYAILKVLPVEVDFYTSNGAKVNTGGSESRTQLLKDADYVKTGVSFLYFPPFMYFSDLVQWITQRNEIHMFGPIPKHIRDPIAGLPWWIFYGPTPEGPQVVDYTFAYDEMYHGTPVLPVYQSAIMGIDL